MAINFPSTVGQPTDGSFTHIESGVGYKWDGESWNAIGANLTPLTDLTAFSVTTNAAGSPALSYNINSGVFSYTPPDLSGFASNTNVANWDDAYSWGDHSTQGYATTTDLNTAVANSANWDTAYGWGDHSAAGYLTAESQTLDDVLALGATTARDISTTGTLLYANVFSTIGALPNATTYHGMFAHVHSEGHGYFAHAGSWTQLLDTGSSIGEIGDVDLSTAPTDNQVLKWDNANSKWIPGSISSAGGGLSNIVDSAQGVNVTGKIATSGGMDIDVGGQITAAGCSVDFGSATISFSGASIGGLTGTIKDATIITWTLTANGTTDYVFSGNGFPTSQNDPDLYLVRGETYRFFNNTGGHPFRIQSTTATSGGGTKYDSGVQNSDGTVNDAGNGVTLTFVVPMDAPDTLYYQCTSHPDMFGTINVLSVGSSSLTIGDDDGTKTNSLKIGDDADLKIYYDGSAGVLTSFIDSDALQIRSESDNSELYATFLKDGPVELYYDGSKKFGTSTAGASVLGNLEINDELHSATGGITLKVADQITSGNMITAAVFGDSIYGPYGLSTYNIADFPGGGISETSTTSGFSVTNNGQIYISTGGGSALWKGKQTGSTTVTSEITANGNATFAGSVSDTKGELRTLPLNEKSSDYTLVTEDAGKAVFFTASTGTITIPNGVFSPGHLITIINDTGTTQSIVQGTGLTMYYTADGSTGNRQATQRSSTTILFKDTSIAYISGTGLS